MAQLARLKKFNCFDKVKGGIQARTENKTKLCLEAWLHTVATCWQLTTQPVQITFLSGKKNKKKILTSPVLKGISWSLQSFLLYLVSGNDTNKTNYIVVPFCIIRPVRVTGLRASEEGCLQNAKLYPEFKPFCWRRTQKVDIGLLKTFLWRK